MNQQYGSFLQRFVAFFVIDGIITYTPFVLIFGLKAEYGPLEWGIYTIFWTLYFVWMTGQYGATIGKMVMKLKVVKVGGSKVSYSDALVRELASYLSAIVFFLGYLNVIWDPKKQAWHDKIAKTVVIRVK